LRPLRRPDDAHRQVAGRQRGNGEAGRVVRSRRGSGAGTTARCRPPFDFLRRKATHYTESHPSLQRPSHVDSSRLLEGSDRVAVCPAPAPGHGCRGTARGAGRTRRLEVAGRASGRDRRGRRDGGPGPGRFQGPQASPGRLRPRLAAASSPTSWPASSSTTRTTRRRPGNALRPSPPCPSARTSRSP
jgi:hypothetical protein